MTSTSLAALLAVPCLLFCSLSMANPEPVDSTIKASTKAAVSSAITAGKNVLSGVSEGVVDGRESAAGADGAFIISTAEQMKGRVHVNLLKTESRNDGIHLELGLMNTTKTPLRLINLKQTGNVLIIDQAHYVTDLVDSPKNPDQMTLAPNSGRRHTFIFKPTKEPLKSVRILGQDHPLAR